VTKFTVQMRFYDPAALVAFARRLIDAKASFFLDPEVNAISIHRVTRFWRKDYAQPSAEGGTVQQYGLTYRANTDDATSWVLVSSVAEWSMGDMYFSTEP
jgi:hypothetical protein